MIREPLSGEETAPPAWTIQDGLDLYNIPGWGVGFFGVNGRGNMTVAPFKEHGPAVDLKRVVEDVRRRGFAPPLLIRFPDILRARVETLHQLFQAAMAQQGYPGRYWGVYPIKVNQQRQVVEEILASGAPYGLGLEAGSKPELQIILALLDDPQAPIICNGYKDDAFIRLALLGRSLGRRLFIVLENPGEVERLIRLADQLAVEPLIGLRLRLDTAGSGRWQKSGGAFSKFGLTAAEVLTAVERLRRAGLLAGVQLLHFHLGSQITDILQIKKGLQEASRYYAALHQLGCPLQLVDVGGGLGVDYDGSRSVRDASVNYSLREYVADVVSYLAAVCREQGLPCPDILSESGRALTAHHAMLLFDLLDVGRTIAPEEEAIPAPTAAPVVRELERLWQGITPDNLRPVWHKLLELRENYHNLFTLGYLDLPGRAQCDTLFRHIVNRLHGLGREDGHILPREIAGLQAHRIEKYHGNFSVFQSLPDSWAVGQLFPVAPIQRLHERPEVQVTLQDLTCDSDGCIDHFIGREGVRHALALHEQRPGESYWIGVFLVGAYQEILGELHNLFGHPHVVQVMVTGEDQWEYRQPLIGQSVRDVLQDLDYNPAQLLGRVEESIRRGVAAGRSTVEAGEAFRAAFIAALDGSTYLGGDGETAAAQWPPHE